MNILIDILMYIAVVAASVSGVFEARRKDMDLVGAVTIGMITALGGGTLRDMLLGNFPVFWIDQQIYAFVALGASMLAFYSTTFLDRTQRSIMIPDAIGLGLFSIIGCTSAYQAGAPVFIVSLMGVITGVFGGILRDVICNEIPVVFARRARLYATCSWIGSWLFIILLEIGVHVTIASTVGVILIIVLRIMSVRLNLSLPEPKVK